MALPHAGVAVGWRRRAAPRRGERSGGGTARRPGRCAAPAPAGPPPAAVVAAVTNAAFEGDPPPYSPPDPKSVHLLYPPLPGGFSQPAPALYRPGPPPAQGPPPCPPALPHLRGAGGHGAIAAPAQGLHGGVGAGDRLLLPTDWPHRPPLLPRDPGRARPRRCGLGKRGIQKGPDAGPLQPPLRLVRLHQLGHLRPGGPVPVTGTPSPRDRAGLLTAAPGGTGRWSGRSPRVALLGLPWGRGGREATAGPGGSARPSWQGEEPLWSRTCLHARSQPREPRRRQEEPRPKPCWRRVRGQALLRDAESRDHGMSLGGATQHGRSVLENWGRRWSNGPRHDGEAPACSRCLGMPEALTGN
ncbi:proline rich transmembrane protein 1B isoform X2 [Falco naumanni]|uniref:proline rich transmembrane protein 1B isoform X2 n=1 Tax=Falco naumanni TaxID=148594 RepID=UPI001ADEBD9B|nr:proline rich transmembrane protein 1B isoform X2 [Falco naumanni]